MDYPNKGISYPDWKIGSVIAKTDQNKLEQFAEKLKSVFITKVEPKDKSSFLDLERKIGNVLIFNVQDYSPLKILMFKKNSLALMKFIRSSTI